MTDTRLPEPLSEAEAGDYIEDDPEAWRTWVALFREYGSKLPEMAAHLGSEDGAVDVLAGAMLSRLAGQYGLLIVRAATLDAARQAAPSREALAAELTDAMILRSLSAL